MQINYKKLNPVGFHLLKLLPDPTKRQIILYGGSSSGKSYSVAQCFLLTILMEGQNMMVMRKVGASIKDSIYQSFKAAADQLGIRSLFVFKDGVRIIKCLVNGAEIIFKGLDDSEKIKGMEKVKRVFMDEWNEYDEGDYKQMKLRLRGTSGQQLVFAFNPIKETHWIKKNVFDAEEWHDMPMDVEIGGKQLPLELTTVKSIRINSPKPIMHKRTGEIVIHPADMVVIQTTYLNNFWVIGSPDGKYGYYDDQCIANFEHDRLHDPDYYNVYALGEWGVIRTGSEFFGSFNRGQHTAEIDYNPHLPIHISIDSNYLPYISVTYWQIDTAEGHHIKQIWETCAESPNNNARKSALLTSAKLHEYGVDKVYLHGDATTRNSNTIDEYKRSFLDLFIETLKGDGIEVTDCVGKQNPNVAMTGEFINAVFDKIIPDIKITIGEHCKTSIEDYMSVQKDVNGAILKTKVKNKITGQSYEEHGHLSDTFRYLVADVVREQFLSYSNKRKRNLYAKDGAIHFYNPNTECKYGREVVYCMPNVNGKCAMVHGKMCGDKWHIVNLALRETASTDEIKTLLMHTDSPTTVIECGPAYFRFVKDLRKDVPGVRAMTEAPDLDRRIAATSDYVRHHLLFNETALADDVEYAQFMTNLLDYNKDSENKEASAVLSGFIQFVVKFSFEDTKSVTSENTKV